MAPSRSWADLSPDLLRCVGNRLDLKWYASARGACTAWRRALAPPSPAVLVATNGDMWCPYAASLPTMRSFELTSTLPGVRCVGSSNGWLTLSVQQQPGGQTVFALFNPITADEIVLPPLTHEVRWVLKVVFAPNPTKEDFIAAAICDIDRIAYVTAGARRWAVMDPVRLAFDDQLIDILYTDSGKVYCLTKCGDVHLLRIPEHCRREPASADEAGPSEPEFSVLQPHLPPATNYQDLYMAGFQGPHMNAPATVEPLFAEAKIRFTPATVFAPPYGTVSALTLVKNLVFCKGNLYQVWRNASCNVSYQLVKSGQCRILENEIFVLRYYPQRQPCWDVVKDLGGYSFFVGRNNAVSIYAEGVPGLKGNCVYWIGGRGRDQGMIFDMATRQTAPCQAPQVEHVPRYLQRTICWYFLSDIVSSCSGGGRRVE